MRTKLFLLLTALFFTTTTFSQEESKTMLIMKGGETTHEIPVSAIDSMIFYQPKMNIDFVEINGIKWATRNVGDSATFVTNSEDYGDYYTWDEAQSVCPSGWRLPTRYELDSIAMRYEQKQFLPNENVASEWLTTENGIKGRQFTDITTGNSIFLPAAGSSYDGMLDDVGMYGNYWSSTESDTPDAYYRLGFRSSGANVYDNHKSNGQSVRCVLK